MNSLTNSFRIDNDLHALLSEATNYVHERQQFPLEPTARSVQGLNKF